MQVSAGRGLPSLIKPSYAIRGRGLKRLEPAQCRVKATVPYYGGTLAAGDCPQGKVTAKQGRDARNARTRAASFCHATSGSRNQVIASCFTRHCSSRRGRFVGCNRCRRRWWFLLVVTERLPAAWTPVRSAAQNALIISAYNKATNGLLCCNYRLWRRITPPHTIFSRFIFDQRFIRACRRKLRNCYALLSPAASKPSQNDLRANEFFSARNFSRARRGRRRALLAGQDWALLTQAWLQRL